MKLYDGMKLMCMLCGRDSFIRTTPHNCNCRGNIRKRNIVWRIRYGAGLWKIKK